MSDSQKPTGICMACDRVVRYVQRDPWEFNWRCVCGCAGVLCWDEGNPPQTFQPQPDLFSEAQA